MISGILTSLSYGEEAKVIWLLALLICFSIYPQSTERIFSADRFQVLNSAVRDGEISKNAAKDSFMVIINAIRSEYKNKVKISAGRGSTVFPVKGYSSHQIGGSNGSSYVPGNYNYFDGNQHTGHPSYDIFIYDRNQDMIDDKTGKFVEVLSMSSGVVIAADTGWKAGSDLRGGNYLWLFDPIHDYLYYYAHNHTIDVRIGDVITAGQRIATVGRSGKNAHPKRSPTHLHLTVLTIKGDVPMPIRFFKELRTAKLIQ